MSLKDELIAAATTRMESLRREAEARLAFSNAWADARERVLRPVLEEVVAAGKESGAWGAGAGPENGSTVLLLSAVAPNEGNAEVRFRPDKAALRVVCEIRAGEAKLDPEPFDLDQLDREAVTLKVRQAFRLFLDNLKTS